MGNDYEEYAGHRYYDSFDPESAGEGAPEDLRWDKVLFAAGKICQSRELNEVQSIATEYRKRIGSSIWKNGDVISGCQLYKIKEDGTRFINILAGKIFIDGQIRHIPQQNHVIIDGTRFESLGLVKTVRYVTEGEDSSLRDPAEDFDNYNQPGAHRRVYDYNWKRYRTNADTTAVTIFDLYYGFSRKQQIGIEYSRLSEDTARKFYDHAGNFMVERFKVNILDRDTTSVWAEIDRGKCYVSGFEVDLGTGQRLVVEKARQVSSISEEAVTFEEDARNKPTYIYELANAWVKQIDTVEAVVYRNEEKTRGAGATDTLDNTPVEEIYQVVDYGGGATNWDGTKHSYLGVSTTYTSGVDYQMNGNAIEWLIDPGAGTVYYVVYGTRESSLTEGVRTKTRVTAHAVTRSANRYDVIGYSDNRKDGISIVRITDSASSSVPTWLEDINYTFVTGRDPDQQDANILTELGGTTEPNYERGIFPVIIDWREGGPAVAETYYVTYDYWEHSTEGVYCGADSYDNYTDIDEITASDNFTTVPLRDCIDFRGLGEKPVTGKLDPVPGENMLVSYQHYLSRIDLIYLDFEGVMYIKQGDPAVDPKAPGMPAGTIGIAYLRLDPYTSSVDDVNVVAIPNKRYQMHDIADLEERVKRLEYTQATQICESNALGQYTIAEKRGIFTDTFSGSRQSDLTYDDGTRSWEVSVDPRESKLRLGFKMKGTDLTISSFDGDETDWEDTITLPFTEKVLFKQQYATGYDSVQPFEVFDAKGELSLVPESDYWTDTDRASSIDVDVTGEMGHRKIDLGTEWGSWRGYVGWDWQSYGAWSTSRTGIQKTLIPYTQQQSLGNRVIDTGWATWVRSRDLVGVAEAMRPSITDLEVDMAERRMTVSAAAASYVVGSAHEGDPGWYVDTASNTVKTDENGFTAFKFTIPEGTFKIGTHEVRVDNPNANKTSRTFATANYVAQGLTQTVQATNIKVTQYRVRSTAVRQSRWMGSKQAWVNDHGGLGGDGGDPLAQTFKTAEDQVILSSIDIFFKDKDDNENVLVQIRDVINGYPAAEILTYGTVKAADVSTSSNGATATNIKFKDAVILNANTEYAIVVFSRSPNYSIFYGEIGENDLVSGVKVSSNPFSGVYFRSANGSAWQADGFKDMKFTLYRANFTSPATIVWNNVTGIKAGWIVPHIVNAEPKGTHIGWEYSDDAGSTWNNCEALDEIDLDTVATQFQLRAQLRSDSSWVSPLLTRNKQGIISVLSRSDGNYYSKTITLDQTSQNVDIYLDEYLPENTTINVYYSTDSGRTWDSATAYSGPAGQDYSKKAKDAAGEDDWWEYHYQDLLVRSGGTRWKIRIEMQTSNLAKTPAASNLRAIFY